MSYVALFGNPNTGKTSLFNCLTGSYEYVGNWSGVTVEKKVGVLRQHGVPVVDLPGIYSLQPLSRDEGVATDFLLTEPCSAIVNIVDASQLKRNLHLTVQLLEFGRPLIIALNMVDVAEKRGVKIDAAKLSRHLGVPVVPVIAERERGQRSYRAPFCRQKTDTIPAFLLITALRWNAQSVALLSNCPMTCREISAGWRCNF